MRKDNDERSGLRLLLLGASVVGTLAAAGAFAAGHHGAAFVAELALGWLPAALAVED